MVPRYVVFPGYVESITDGDLHYIGVYDLCRLYGVDTRQCVDMNSIYAETLLPATLKGMIPLRPDPAGRYVLPTH